MKTVTVKFVHTFTRQTNPTEYDFITTMGDLEKGDLVVVETKYGFAVAKVVRYANSKNNLASAFVVQKIDTSELVKAKEVAEKRERILQRIEEKKQEISERMILEQLAKSDEDMASLLAELDSI